MENKIIGFDLHGADKGMDAIIEGLKMYIEESKTSAHFHLFGNEQEAQASLEKFGLADNQNIKIIATTQVIVNEEEPALALRRKKDSSMVVGAKALKAKEIDCLVSSGSTGALVAAGIFLVGRIKGIDRPALGGLLPSAKGSKPSLILDLGANVEAKPEHLVAYAQIGSQFMNSLYAIKEPRVALINVGSEDGKGNALYKETFSQLQATDLNFSGNIEARDVLTTSNDVLVIDGFSGNILLKSIEGTVGVFNSSLKQVFLKNALTKISALAVKSGLKEMKQKFDYRELGATPIFGVNGILLKAHGSSDAVAFKNAFRSAEQTVESKFLENFK